MIKVEDCNNVKIPKNYYNCSYSCIKAEIKTQIIINRVGGR